MVLQIEERIKVIEKGDVFTTEFDSFLIALVQDAQINPISPKKLIWIIFHANSLRSGALWKAHK